ncbi:7TM-DISM domain-containing protein, partial [uncultured Pseudoalteromonas sp.]
MTSPKALFSLFMLLCSFCSVANPVISENFKSIKIDTLSYSFTPTTANNAYHEVSDWQTVSDKPLNLGFEQRPVWVKFTVKNTLNNNISPILSLDNPLLNEA